MRGMPLHCISCSKSTMHIFLGQSGRYTLWQCRNCHRKVVLATPGSFEGPTSKKKSRLDEWKEEVRHVIAGLFLLFAFVLWTRGWKE